VESPREFDLRDDAPPEAGDVPADDAGAAAGAGELEDLAGHADDDDDDAAGVGDDSVGGG
jgi:hypothetical protein